MEFKQKKVMVEGVEYTLQKLPIREALQLRQKWLLPNGGTDELIMSDECLKHIVVMPKVKLDDFEDIITLETLVAECVVFQYMERQTKETSEKE